MFADLRREIPEGASGAEAYSGDSARGARAHHQDRGHQEVTGDRGQEHLHPPGGGRGQRHRRRQAHHQQTGVQGQFQSFTFKQKNARIFEGFFWKMFRNWRGVKN